MFAIALTKFSMGRGEAKTPLGILYGLICSQTNFRTDLPMICKFEFLCFQTISVSGMKTHLSRKHTKQRKCGENLKIANFLWNVWLWSIRIRNSRYTHIQVWNVYIYWLWLWWNYPCINPTSHGISDSVAPTGAGPLSLSYIFYPNKKITNQVFFAVEL